MVGRGVVVGVVVALAGVLVVTGVDASGSAEALQGDLLALGGGVAGALLRRGGGAGAPDDRDGVVHVDRLLDLRRGAAAGLPAQRLHADRVLDARRGSSWLLTLCAQLLGTPCSTGPCGRPARPPWRWPSCWRCPGASLVAWLWLGQVPPVAVVPGAALVLAGLAVVIRTQSTSRRAVAEPLSP